MLDAGTGALLRSGGCSEFAAGDADSSDELIARRSFLLRVAVVGSALATAPLRYLLYPGTALAAVVGPLECRSGKCADGYTEFCCEINQGGVNACPTGTFAGGWWMCTDYAGSAALLRAAASATTLIATRCPAIPSPAAAVAATTTAATGASRATSSATASATPHIDGTTAVVCRLVVCENPATISELHCSAALATDNAVCGHEAPCLEPAALELVGAGGV